MKKRDIIIDADHILFFVAEAKFHKERDAIKIEELEDGCADWDTEIPELNLEPYIKHFKDIVEDYVLTAEVESICYGWTLGETKVILSDSTNFRYELYPEYKAGRNPKSDTLKALAKWAKSEYIVEPNTEADDVVAYYVRQGGLGFTTDKDLFKGVSGIWFNTHYKHRCWVRTSEKEAEHFFKCQSLAGDPVDKIPALSGVGIPTASKLLNKHGDSWQDILQIYLDRGYSKDYMLTMVRLVAMNQWTPKKGVKLWKIPKKH